MSTHEETALASFLVTAKLACYAADDERHLLTLADGGREVSFSAGELRYRDRWYGGASFAGQELVWSREGALWSMTFHGVTVRDAPAELFHFHKRALRHMPPAAPWRGPALHVEGAFAYVNDWSGTVARFHGVERVSHGETELLRVEYRGGLLD